jgi:polyisoprenoid-binding protein YceI
MRGSCLGFAMLPLVLVATLSAPAIPRLDPVHYEIDPEHSSVMFKVKHLAVSTVTGRFNRFAGSFWYDATQPGAIRVTATADVASIDTDNARRDDHLRSEDFFWAERHPTMTFESREVRKNRDDEFEVVGDLTIRGVTRSVVLEVEIEGVGRGTRGEPVMGLTATTEINRHDFGLRWNRAIESGGWVVGDEVQIVLELEARGA